MAQPSKTEIQVASRVLQACIVAIPFWLTAVRYWISNIVDEQGEGVEKFDFMTAFVYGSNVAGLLALVLAVNFSGDILTSGTGSQLQPILRLVNLFTLIAFGLLISAAADHLSETRGTFFMYHFIALLIGFIIVIGYLWNIIAGIIALVVVFLLGGYIERFYNYNARKWRTRESADSFYRNIGTHVALYIASLNGFDADLSGIDEDAFIRRLTPLLGREDAEHFLDEIRRRERERLVRESMEWLSDPEHTAQLAEEAQQRQKLEDAGEGLDWLFRNR